VPAAALVAEDDGEVKRLFGGKQICKITVRMKKTNGSRGGKTVSGTYALNAETLEAARKTAREILDECEGKTYNRPRCGKDTREKGGRKDDRGRGVARLRSGKARGWVARLEEILDGRLDGAPEVAYARFRWRIGGMAARKDGKSGRWLASAIGHVS
jgi:hypothetical protein